MTPPAAAPLDPSLLHDQFLHVRVLVGMITGLAMARLLNGLARFVQHPGRERVYLPHLLWSFALLLAVVHFWWFELGLGQVGRWTAEAYLLVILYGALHFFTCTLLYPDRMDDYSGFRAYFHARQRWFYGLVAALLVTDMADSALKGAAHFASLGPFYPVRQLGLAALVLAVGFVAAPAAHLAVAGTALAAEIWRIVSQFQV